MIKDDCIVIDDSDDDDDDGKDDVNLITDYFRKCKYSSSSSNRSSGDKNILECNKLNVNNHSYIEIFSDDDNEKDVKSVNKEEHLKFKQVNNDKLNTNKIKLNTFDTSSDDSDLEIPLFERLKKYNNKFSCQVDNKVNGEHVGDNTEKQEKKQFHEKESAFIITDDDYLDKDLTLDEINALINEQENNKELKPSTSYDNEKQVNYTKIKPINKIEIDDDESSSDDDDVFIQNVRNRLLSKDKLNHETKKETIKIREKKKVNEILKQPIKDNITKLDKFNAKQEKLKLKQLERQRKIELRDAQRKLNFAKSKDGRLRSCIALIDRNLFDSKFLNENDLKNLFALKEMNFETVDSPLTPLSIRWINEIKLSELDKDDSDLEDNVEDDNNNQLKLSNEPKVRKEENEIIVIINSNEMIKMVSSYKNEDEYDEENNLYNYVYNVINKERKNVTFIYYGIESYFRKIINKENKKFINGVLNNDKQKRGNKEKATNKPNVTRNDLDDCLFNIQLKLTELDDDLNGFNVNFLQIDNINDLSLQIYSQSKAIALKPIKQKHNEQYGLQWYAQADNHSAVDPIDLNSISKLWIQQLQQFPKISFDIANSICKKFRTPKCLLDEYKRLNSVELSEMALANVEIIKLHGISNRRIGPEISKRVHRFLTGNKGTIMINS